jgi:uncharacterized repeat protein (TIGR03803 family)
MKSKKVIPIAGALVLILAVFVSGGWAATKTILHDFAGGVGGGESPVYGILTLSGAALYGMTKDGGVANDGTLFKINADGTGFTLLHSFGVHPDNGRKPYGSLIMDDAMLYGTTKEGGASGYGVIFKIQADGSGYTVLHSFAGGAGGSSPFGGLTLSGSALYGTASSGGSADLDAVFKINTDGTGYTVIHSFGTWAGGAYPCTSLTQDGATLYGTAKEGGVSGCGVIFKIQTDGSGYTVLHSFAGGAGGSHPYGALTLSGSLLYGMTSSGGTAGYGTIFRLGADGSGYTVVHDLANWAGGAYPYGGLTLSGNTLYGMTSEGGAVGLGVIFKLEGATLITLRSFTGLRSGDDVVLKWETGAEIANAGFHVWRSLAKAGPYAKITQTLLPAEGSPSQGANYTYTDRNRPERTWYYKLEDIDNRGKSTFHGPIAVAMTAPLEAAITLLSPANGSALASTPLSFSWSGEGFSGYRLQFCASENFTGRVITVPLANWVKAEAYTPSRFVWNNVKTLGKNGAAVYWRVVGKQGKTVVASGAFVLR